MPLLILVTAATARLGAKRSRTSSVAGHRQSAGPRLVTGRASAGQEHVVALALMAALQRNAPIGGPIVMDSPFGRLDEGHTSRIIGTLPDMADQSVLLVYRAEVDQETLRSALGARQLREYRLDRVTSRHTRIVEVRE